MEDIEKLKIDNEKLKKMNEVKSDLISISAHQLRTSLSAMKWIFKMFLDEDLGKLSNEQSSFIQKAYSSNEKMINLVNDLLTLSHAEDTTIAFEFKDTDLVSLIEQSIFEFSGETTKRKVELFFMKPEEPLPHVKCDEEMIQVVLQNLIENAIKYSHNNSKVFISIKRNGENIEISVHDNGIGIKDGDKDNIFKKFFRSQNAIEKDNIGSGLGLFTTKNIVEEHQGKIWFENSENNGTTFFVSLPINIKMI